jgi:hypothetical protein
MTQSLIIMKPIGSEEKTYTYTIITTDSNKQLKFLHDRMPVILESGSDDLKKWLDPFRHEWSRELQSLLKPFDGELEVYPVSKEVGKVGNNSPSFIIPIDSKENKSNIANFFANHSGGGKAKSPVKISGTSPQKKASEAKIESDAELDNTTTDLKRKASDTAAGEVPPTKKISATQNMSKSPQKGVKPGAQKITKFFNSA